MRTEPFTPKKKPKKEVDYFWKHQTSQDYDTTFDNSIPFRKNDPLWITYFKIQGVSGLHFVPNTKYEKSFTTAAFISLNRFLSPVDDYVTTN